jgi:hypothetical protein
MVLNFAKGHGHLNFSTANPMIHRLSTWLSKQKERKFVSVDEHQKLNLLKTYGYKYDDRRTSKDNWNSLFEQLSEH